MNFGYVAQLTSFDGAMYWWVDTGATATLNGIWAAANNNVFAVGNRGVILHSAINGGSLTLQPEETGTTQDLHGVWGSGAWNTPVEVYAVGEGGVILRRPLGR